LHLFDILDKLKQERIAMVKTKVLFLCSGNSARSQMAEAYLRHFAADYFEPYSAGLEPSEINPFTYKVMEEEGISLAGQYAKHVSLYMGKQHFGYLITVCSKADKNCPATFPGISQRMHWDFEDPAAFQGSDEEKLRKFRQVRDQIRERILSWIREQGIEPKKEQS